MRKLERKDLMHLQIIPKEVGYTLKLDEKEVHCVENYKIESEPLSGCAKLTLEVLVRYP